MTRRTPQGSSPHHPRRVTSEDSPVRPVSARERAPSRLVVAVYGTRAGVGVTTIATSLATAFHDLGDGETALARIDPRAGRNAASTTNGAPRASSRPNGHAAPASSTTRRPLPGTDVAVVRRADGVWSLTSTRPATPAAADARGVNVALDALRERFAVSVAELERQVNERTLAAFDAADRIVLVTDGTVPSLRSTQRVLRLCHRLNYPDEKLCVVVNRADAPAALPVPDVAAALKREVYWKIPAGTPVDTSALAAKLLAR